MFTVLAKQGKLQIRQATADDTLTTACPPCTQSAECTAVAENPMWPRGWRPWACLLGCFLLMFNSWGLVIAYGTYASYYEQHLLPGRDLLLLNLVGSTQSFTVLAFSFVVGRLLDAGHYKYLIGLGTVFMTVGMTLLSVVNGSGNDDEGNYSLIWLTQGFVTGLGMACFFVSSSQVVSTWFIQRKAVAIGIVATGASVGGLVYPFMTKFLIVQVGFNKAVRYVATLVWLTSVAAFLLATPNPTHKYRKPKKWTELGVWFDKHAFYDLSFCWFTAGMCFMFFGVYAVSFNLEEWAAAQGFGIKADSPPGFDINLDDPVPQDAIRTFWLLSIMNASSGVGRLITAYFSERYGALNMHAAAAFMSALLIFALWINSTNLSRAIAFVVVYGATSGAIIGLPPASVAHILGRSDPKQQAKLGQWTGMMYTTSAAFSLAGPVIAGHLFTVFGTFLSVQLWSGGCIFMAAACLFIARIYARSY